MYDPLFFGNNNFELLPLQSVVSNDNSKMSTRYEKLLCELVRIWAVNIILFQLRENKTILYTHTHINIHRIHIVAFNVIIHPLRFAFLRSFFALLLLSLLNIAIYHILYNDMQRKKNYYEQKKKREKKNRIYRADSYAILSSFCSAQKSYDERERKKENETERVFFYLLSLLL